MDLRANKIDRRGELLGHKLVRDLLMLSISLIEWAKELIRDLTGNID